MYMVVVTLAFFLGGIFAAVIRLELATPAGDLVSADTYNRLFTMHGVAMVFFVLIPAVPAILGNFVLPLMLGAKDVAFPKINLLSWYVFVHRLRCSRSGAMVTGGVDTGWTFYHALQHRRARTQRDDDRHRRLHHRLLVDPHRPELHGDDPPDARARADLVPAAAVRVGALRDQPGAGARHAGHRHHRARCWRSSAASASASSIRALGGDPVLFQHLFWFYSHPAVYIMILPPMGAISEVIACFSRKNVFGYSFVAFSSLAIAIFGFLVWAHHLFVAGISLYSAMVFSFLTYAVAIPSAVKTFNWTATLYRGRHLAEGADDLGVRLHRPVPRRRPDRPLHGGARPRRPHPRHLLRRRALPLHHGRRRDHGLLRRAALLVAEDDRPDVLRRSGPSWRRCSSSSAST